jgi:hypothetical protein
MLFKKVLKRNFLSLHMDFPTKWDEGAPLKPWKTYWKSMGKTLLKAQSVVVTHHNMLHNIPIDFITSWQWMEEANVKHYPT